jgi:hypothetical protein
VVGAGLAAIGWGRSAGAQAASKVSASRRARSAEAMRGMTGYRFKVASWKLKVTSYVWDSEPVQLRWTFNHGGTEFTEKIQDLNGDKSLAGYRAEPLRQACIE